MIISSAKILELNERFNLIENLSEREAKNPEGVGFDLRAGNFYKLEGNGFLGVTERDTPKSVEIKPNKQGRIVINPGEYFLIKTIEKVNLPSEKIQLEKGKIPVYLMLDVYPRSSLHRSGIYFIGTKTDPGYSGELTFAIANVGKNKFEIEQGARFCNVVFKMVLGDLSRAYEGQWNKGRVSTNGKEKQN